MSDCGIDFTHHHCDENRTSTRNQSWVIRRLLPRKADFPCFEHCPDLEHDSPSKKGGTSADHICLVPQAECSGIGQRVAEKRVGLNRKHKKSGARKVHDHLAGAWIMPPNGDVLCRARDDLAAYFDLAIVVGHDLDPVAGFA